MTDIRDRRQRRTYKKIKKADELYDEAGVADLIVQDELDETPDITETVNYKRVSRRREKPLVNSDFDYQTMAIEYSKENVAQQLGNYRQAMEFLTYIDPPKIDSKLTDRLKDMIYSYPNIDISSFVNKDNAVVYSWVVKSMVRAFGEKYLGALYVLGGGMGILPGMILDTKLRYENIRSFDINGSAQFLADEMMSNELLADWRFKATTQDLFDIDYAEHTFQTRLQNGQLSDAYSEIPGTLINTNISYLRNYKDWFKMIPDMRRVVIVGETGDVPRPFASSQSFNKQFPMNFELYTGVITLHEKQYYMKIGHK
ncbi:hypothetical protein N9R43_00315 [bacterium]|nr:hypothetical protein [bacterium]